MIDPVVDEEEDDGGGLDSVERLCLWQMTLYVDLLPPFHSSFSRCMVL